MLEIPEDLYHLIKNAVSIRNHLERNKKEKDSKFRLILVDSRIHRLARYYNKTKELPQLRHDEEVVVNCFDECSNKTREKEERGVTWMWRRKLLLRVLQFSTSGIYTNIVSDNTSKKTINSPTTNWKRLLKSSGLLVR
ncbi:hypothetical protein JHK87_012257 [Glycine soja]|nr:hypothetical protein JHK87_012257 [Glycine soja]